MFRNGLFVLAAFLAGCTPATEESKDRSPLRHEDSGFIVVVGFDLSGSYATRMAKDGLGWQLMVRILDRYFRDRLAEGTNDRIIIYQLSGRGKKAALWDGTPIQFRQSFASPENFRDFLMANADSGGSRIYDGVRDSVEYLMSYPGVAEGRTRTAVLIGSDFEDNASAANGMSNLVSSLNAYAKMNGTVGYYYVSHGEVELWNRTLRSCGFKPRNFIVQSEIVQTPQLPEFDD